MDVSLRSIFAYVVAVLSFLIIFSANATPLVKAGTVFMANLDTPLNSDTPDTLVTATINHGKLKGAKLIGKLVLEDDTSGDIISSLRFSSIKLTSKTKNAKIIDAYAIDYDEARVVSITQPDIDELKREIATLSSSFFKSYSLKDKLELGPGTEFGILIMSDV